MNAAPPALPPVLNPAPSTARTLRRLFLMLFLRGRSSRGLRKDAVPKSVGTKLAMTLVFYGMFGLFALFFLRQPVFSLSIYLHAMTFMFLGLFVGSSAGEVLFNKEEADILMHRPIEPRALLWAKISVMVQVSLFLAAAFNLVGFFVGIATKDGGWLFPLAHAISTILQALFCTGSVVVLYQLCLRWFGRERLDGLMTTAQVLLTIGFVAGSQVLPRMMGRVGEMLQFNRDTWWMGLLPPAWFAGFDDAVAGSAAPGSWALAGVGLIATLGVLWLAFVKLARDYEAGLQTLGETSAPRKRQRGRRWVEVLVDAPPLRWWLRDPVARASFLLTAAYLFRDREVKLRIYPGMAPLLVMPVIFLVQDHSRGGGAGGFGMSFSSSYLGIVPLFALNLLQYSQQYQASDLFRAAPMAGPAQLCHGARRAVLFLLTLPMLALFGLVIWFLYAQVSLLALLLPGLLAIPVYALIPSVGGKSVPFSLPAEEAKSAGRGLTMIGVMLVSMALSGISLWAWSTGWFWWFLLAETIVAVGLYVTLRASLASVRWKPME
jgi:ABC-2 type transport system permease protein